MAKAYWLSIYRNISDPDKMAAYAKLAAPAVTEAGGRYLVRNTPAEVFESGLQQRAVVIEFDSLEAALAARNSPAYQAALKELGDGAELDFRVVEGV
ncbi:DUF1330 domain-containing protein [Burkholderia gladioli]|uniref:DUF1330 domain-containing protein n=1 Tax=Burkholderia gladioli TaxID=28095 RepID=UPI00163E4424|nr:DUF1330 domain-containing protein [Burkholderia gladioli]MDC6128701.1 DUF1330 domain-containing protein [Burkholderia gladioli]